MKLLIERSSLGKLKDAVTDVKLNFIVKYCVHLNFVRYT